MRFMVVVGPTSSQHGGRTGMGKQFPKIEPEHKAFIERQKIFFVATAPPKGKINVSPKGLSSFRVLGDSDVAYLDCTGSGSETRAHLIAADDNG
jgi:hypothetical protein